MKTRCACDRGDLPVAPGYGLKSFAAVSHAMSNGVPCPSGKIPYAEEVRKLLNSVEHWTDLLDLPKWSVGDAVTWETLERRWDLPRKHGGRVIALHPTKDYPIGVRLDDGDVIDPSICPGALRLA